MAVEHAGNRSQPSLDWVAMTTGTRLDIDLNTAIPEQLRAKQLIGLFVHGTALVAGRPPRSIELTVDGVAHPVIARGMPSPALGPKARAGFWGILPLAAAGDRRARIGARATLGHGSAVEAPLGAVELLAEASEPVAAPAGTGSRTVAICMATHEPPAELLHRQLDSLRAQTHDDWICLISDDASGGERFAALETAIDGDRRFVVSRSDRRLGAYENFHRALRMVPGEVPYVALCDQDDHWHPDKLSTLLEALGDANLVFSDMRITAPDGTLIAPTYWTRRQPNHANFASLLLGNSVTGAASLFPRRLLDQALPFPPRLGNLYHDHWLALVARALGEIAYVPRPLYDYIQHPEAVIGHAGANRGVVGGGLPKRLLALRGRPPGRLRTEWRRIYFAEYCRMRLQAMVLTGRFGDRIGPRERHALRLALLPDRSPVLAGWLATRQLKRLWRDETLGSEAAILRALAWRLGTHLPSIRRGDDPYDDADLPAGMVDPVDPTDPAQTPPRPAAEPTLE